ncbi:UNVERIFIED_CONTAM: hypothetical protein Scaly_3089200 [Sesamum calycinum]|uniref:RNase H type-1 domain-containing protein n=1 Tax=Sesamum calycinum TaxID=2727403 RepID=A0AAW2JP51_9LAMI
MIAKGPNGGDSHHARKSRVREVHDVTVKEVLNVEAMEDTPFIQFGQAERGHPLGKGEHLPVRFRRRSSTSIRNDGNTMEDASKVEKWLLHVDGSSTTQGSGEGIVITSAHGEDLEFAVKFGFKASNNEAEYEALVIGMRMAHDVRARYLVAYSDS